MSLLEIELSSKITMELSEEEAQAVLNGRKGDGRTIIALLVDESGSMSDCVEDTIGGYNSYVDDRKSESGNVLITRAQFGGMHFNEPSPLAPPSDSPRMTKKNYQPSGMTPLLDAMGRTINHVKSIVTSKDRVLFVVMTDGGENASREFDKQKVKKLKEECEAKGNWTFVFTGADFDAIGEAGSVGVAASNVFNFNKTNTKGAYAAMSRATANYLSSDAERVSDFGQQARKLLEEDLVSPNP